MRARVLAVCLLFWAWPAVAQVVIGSTAESHTAGTGSTNEGSFQISGFVTVSPEGGFVCTFQLGAGAHEATAVDWGGTPGTAVTGGLASTTDGDEDGSVQLWKFASIPVGTLNITITRTNSATVLYAVVGTVSATRAVAVYEPGIVLVQSNGTLAEVSPDDGSPGTASLRYACIYSGSTTVPTDGANSTVGHAIDVGPTTAGVWFEDVTGQGARPVGATMTTEDRAVVAFAMAEAPALASASSRALVGVGR